MDGLFIARTLLECYTAEGRETCGLYVDLREAFNELPGRLSG